MNEPDPIVKAPPTLLPNGGRPHMNHARPDARNTEPAFPEVTANRTHRGAGKIDAIDPKLPSIIRAIDPSHHRMATHEFTIAADVIPIATDDTAGAAS
jgi:hypothetical protein